MYAWLGAPLVAQNGKRLQNILWKPQQFHKDGTVECLPGVVLIGFVSWQKRFPLKSPKDALGLNNLLLAKGLWV